LRGVVTKRLKGVCVLFALAVIVGGCAAGQAFRRGDEAMKKGDLDQAVAAFRAAVQADPDNPRYKISLERAMQAASRFHLDRAHQYEQQEQLEAALGEYKLAAEYDPSNRGIAGKVATLEKTLRERLEAARPRPASQQLRERARAASTEPALNPASREPLVINFVNTNFKDILTFVGNYAGINVSYDREVVDRPSTVQLSGVTLEQALTQIMTMNQLSYKVVNEKSIFVFPDTVAKHTQYDEQVIKTFYIQHADATEVVQLLSQVIRLPNMAIQPAIAPNRTNNTITIRASTSVMQILEKLIEQHDKPRAEIVFDIEILEVDRERAKTYGLDLTQFAVGAIFSPEVSPSGTTTQTPGGATPTTPGGGAGNVTTTTTGQATAPNAVGSPPPFNLNTISRGFSTSDFYLAVPAAIVRFLESDTRTKVLAKPQLRGTEGFKATVNLGTEVPIVTTSYTPIATGGAGVNPLNSFNLKPVGINIDITPRVTLDGDILIDLTLESSAQGPDQNIAGTNYPSFVTRKVGTHLRLRDGESNLLAGLLREDDRTSVRGFPGAVHVPVLKQAFSSNDNRKSQIDLIMLLTPHIVRSNEITEQDLKSTFIGSQQNLGLGGGPPPLIAPLPEAEAPAAPPAATPPAAAPRPPGAPGPAQPGGVTLTPPPGTPVPGFVPVPAPAPQTPPPAPAATTPPATNPPAIPPPTPTPAPQVPPPTSPTPQSATPPAVPEPPTAGAPVGSAQVVISPPGGTFRVGQGPYTVPLSIVGAARLSTVSLTITYDPAVLRVRSVQEGSFMRLGGANATFTQETAPGRIDVTITRSADATGASGTGLLAAVVFDAIAPGTSQLTASGVGTGPGGTPMGLQFRPVTVAVQR
jgi:general secretion pathway protein D